MGGRGARVAIGEQSEATIGERCSAIFDGPAPASAVASLDGSDLQAAARR